MTVISPIGGVRVSEPPVPVDSSRSKILSVSSYFAFVYFQGYVAVFLEHNDGSGSSCNFPDGRVTGYTAAPDLSSISSPANRDFR